MVNEVDSAIEDARERCRLIASHTLWNTKRFLQLLSADVPPTDAYVSEQESICFDWDENCQCKLSVMVQHGGRIAFAAYFNVDRLNGAANVTGAELPERTDESRVGKERSVRGGLGGRRINK